MGSRGGLPEKELPRGETHTSTCVSPDRWSKYSNMPCSSWKRQQGQLRPDGIFHLMGCLCCAKFLNVFQSRGHSCRSSMCCLRCCPSQSIKWMEKINCGNFRLLFYLLHTYLPHTVEASLWRLTEAAELEDSTLERVERCLSTCSNCTRISSRWW